MDALILGASGLVGGELLQLILADPRFEKVKVIVRKPLLFQHVKLEQFIGDYSTVMTLKEKLVADVVFSCLGSTKAKTPNLQEYYTIDHDYPLLVGQLCFEHGAKSFHLISSIGSNSSSSNFYLKMKGETEQDISAIGFNALHIYQPALLTGNRKEKRGMEGIAELIMRLINPLLIGSFKKYQSITAKTVASFMLKQALSKSKGKFIHQSDKIKENA